MGMIIMSILICWDRSELSWISHIGPRPSQSLVQIIVFYVLNCKKNVWILKQSKFNPIPHRLKYDLFHKGNININKRGLSCAKLSQQSTSFLGSMELFFGLNCWWLYCWIVELLDFWIVELLNCWIIELLNCWIVDLLSKPNNNHNPNNKTTITVVGLRLSNHWEPPPPTTNSKLHDRAEIKQYFENKNY